MATFPRRLEPDERHVLDVLLSRPFKGRDELRAQVSVATVTGLSCDCGCPSIGLAVDRTAAPAPAHGMVADGVGVDAAGSLVGALLWVDDEGYMNDIEVFGYGPDIHGQPATTIHGWPTVESFERPEPVFRTQPTSGDGLGTTLRNLLKRSGQGKN